MLSNVPAGKWETSDFVDINPPSLFIQPQDARPPANLKENGEAYLNALRKAFEGKKSEIGLSTLLLPLCSMAARGYHTALTECNRNLGEKFRYIRRFGHSHSLKGKEFQLYFPIWRDIRNDSITKLQATVDALENPSRMWKEALGSETEEADWICMMGDFRCTLTQMQRDRQRFDDHINHTLSFYNLNATLRSEEQTARNRYLSILAFIYIPLSFIASFFGMNVGLLGSGSVRMWIPVTSGLGLLTAMLGVMLLIPFCARGIESCRTDLAWLPD